MKIVVCVIMCGISLVSAGIVKNLFHSSIEFAVEKSVISLGHSRRFARCFVQELKSSNTLNGLKNLNPVQLAIEMPKVLKNSLAARDFCRIYENLYLILFCGLMIVIIMSVVGYFCCLKFRR